MIVLFVSNLSGNLWAGPNNSVPAQVRAQKEIDDVFWFNSNHVKRREWTEGGLDCKNLDDIPSGRLCDFPEPFNKPDIVIFEEFYCFPFNKIIADVRKNKIPYVIVPRSELTEAAQRNKPLKKKIGNILFFSRFAKNASAIQYLTDAELKESGQKWNKTAFVIPNGITIPQRHKENFSVDCVNASYIGRVDVYQKGLDLLIEAISGLKDDLLNNKFHLSIYGPDRDGALDFLKRKVLENGLEDIVSFYESVFGEDKANVLLNTDVFIMTSRFEGMPMGLIEALSYGIPCLVTEGTNLLPEVKRADAGWIAKNGVSSVQDALRTVIFTRCFKEKGRNSLLLSKEFSWKSIAEKTHEMFEKIKL